MSNDGLKRPRRRYELEIKIGADTWESAMSELHLVAFELMQRDEDRRGHVDTMSTGYTANHTVTGDCDRTITGDTYRAALDAYVSGMRITGEL